MTSRPHPATPLTECTLQLSAEAGRVLLAEARAAMAAQLGQPAPPAVVATAAAWLRQPAATHVTLTLEGKLRGAAGAPPARQALCEDLRSNALAAAFHDPRFKAITSNELDGLFNQPGCLWVPEMIKHHGA